MSTKTLRWNDVRIQDLKSGQQLQVDHHFECVPPLAVVTVHYDGVRALKNKNKCSGFHFHCDHGKHFLDLCLDTDYEHIIGVRRPT